MFAACLSQLSRCARDFLKIPVDNPWRIWETPPVNCAGKHSRAAAGLLRFLAGRNSQLAGSSTGMSPMLIL